jgi:hypothetical protein
MMRPLIPAGYRFAVILVLSFFLGIGPLSAPSPVAAQAQYIVQPVAEMKVKQLLKGTKPTELPVMQSTKFKLAIDLKIAKALGLTLPSGLLSIVDDVIE